MLYRNIVIDEQLLEGILWERMNIQMAFTAVWDGNQLKKLNQIYYNEKFKPVYGEYKNCLYLSSDYIHLKLMEGKLDDMDICFVNTGFNDSLGINMEHEIPVHSIQGVQGLLEKTSSRKSL